MISHVLLSLVVGLAAAALTFAACLGASYVNPDKTIGGAYAAMAMMLAPIAFAVGMGGYWVWRMWA